MATMARQGIAVAARATSSLVARPKPSTGNLPSIATRTLAVVASLWSSSSSSPVYRNEFLPRFALPNLLPLPCVSAFQPETRRGWHPREQRRIINHRRPQQEQPQYWQPNNKNNDTIRRYHNSPRRLLPILSASGDDESIASPTPTAAVSSDVVASTSHLPRLFIAPYSESYSDAIENEDTNTIIPLRTNSLIPLTADQEHYLLDVMRITNPKRWGRGKTSSAGAGDDRDYTGCVRVFNGADGEWLARVVEDPSGGEGGGNPKKQRRKRGGNKNHAPRQSQRAVSSGAVLECLELMRPQETSVGIGHGQLKLYAGYIKDKARRRWVFEKATELGIDSISILETDFSNGGEGGKDSYKKKDLRWEDDREKHKLHVIEAAEQCERLTVPSVEAALWSVDAVSEAVVALNDVSVASAGTDGDITGEKEQHLWLVCRERSESSPPILSVLEDFYDVTVSSSSQASTTIHVLVGPEGGWSPRELELFSSLRQVRFVSLGSSVLRAETAAIVAVSSVQMHRDTLG